MKDLKEDRGVYYKKKEYAGFTKRVIIAAVDFIVIMLFAAFCLFVTGLFLQRDIYFKMNFFIILLFSLWYLAVLKRSKYRTIGYILTGVKIVDLEGKKPSVLKMVFRALLLFLGPFGLLYDIIWLTGEPTRQTLRDKYIGTYVVRKDSVPAGKSKIKSVNLGILGWNLMYREVKDCPID